MADIASKCREVMGWLSGAPQEVVLVAAAKTRSYQEVLESVKAGVRVVGENRVQEAEGKYGSAEGLRDLGVELHFIGKLQRNKVNRVLRLFDCIQSLDSPELLEAVNKRAERPVRGLLEVNIGGEESKGGFRPEALEGVANDMGRFKKVRIEGLMAVEPYSPEPEDARPYFREMKQLFERLKQLKLPGNVEMKVLSMGMSGSYKVAVDEGSNMVRIGTGIFGKRES